MIAPSHPFQHRRTAALAAGLAALGLAAAGCGGSAKAPSVASLGPVSTSTSGGTTEGAAVGNSAPPTSSARSRNGGQMTMVGGSVEQLTKFATCMRKNGESSFPDPNARGQISANVDPGSVQFQQAQQACRKLLPNGGQPSPAQEEQMRSQALAFSACMRSHGEPSFPDPQFGTGGRVSLKISAGSGLDPQSLQFQAAQKACQKELPGGGPKTAGGGLRVAG